MNISQENLDKRICDIENESENTQTIREFIRESEEQFGFTKDVLEKYTDNELKRYVEELDYLWTK